MTIVDVRRVAITSFLMSVVVVGVLIAMTGGWNAYLLPFLVCGGFLAMVAIMSRQGLLVMHALVGLAFLLYLLSGGFWGVLFLPFFLVAWLFLAGVIKLLDRGPDPVRLMAWWAPFAIVPLTFVVLIAFSLSIR